MMSPGRCLIVFFALAGPLAAASSGPIESLIDRSPFLPPGYRASSAESRVPQQPTAPSPSAASRMELIGVVAGDGAINVSLRKKGEARGIWLKPGEVLDNVRFVRFDLSEREAVVDTDGRRETIPLKPPTVSAMPSVPNQPPMGNPNQRQATASPPNPPESSNIPRVPVRRRVILPAE